MTRTTNGYVYCAEINERLGAPELIDFGIRDARGRAIGYRIIRSKVGRTEREAYAEPRSEYGPICKPEQLGIWFTADANPTRNGERFGASTRTLYARTAEELEALIAARVEGARARYAKIGVTP